ncbi:MAG: adenosylmethionine--8-amino-7-oxononanoate transaminase [Rhodospirillales bacterium]|jgi:adenosylmethionine-8-amino-7-oxononanoate aminotransferase|nr:adenosylmethionine--8-amino-7-oxononanoate transaminase [Rhodospirillales bacterium]
MTSRVWHPFTQHALHPQMPLIERASGSVLHGADGKDLIDAISSWWVITHGHCHPPIARAIQEQAARLDQMIFAGLTHEPAERLAERLVRIAPKGLDYVFFSDSGSTAVEVGLKMALGYWRNRGQARSKFVALEGGYHGDTVGTMSVGARGVFTQAYEPVLFQVTHLPFPSEGCEQACLDALETACKQGDVAGFVVEPLILGAGGMLIYAPKVLTEMKRICERFGVLFIADEVMTGFGRTGSLFACEQAGITPDILCLAKGMTGGAVPLAATLCWADIFEAHYSEDRTKTFFHSSSYTANPIACAAANANLDVWETEPVLERIARLGRMQEERLARFEGDERFLQVRRLGTIAALDVKVQDQGYLAGIGPKLYERFIASGVLLRPLGNTIYVMPPYGISGAQLDKVWAAVGEAASAGFVGS